MELVRLFYQRLLKSENLSYKQDGTHTSLLLLTDKPLTYEANLSSYESACKEDQELRTFDSSLRQRTSEFISSLAAPGGKTECSSLNLLKEVIQFLLSLSELAVNYLFDSKEDLSNNKELKSLIDRYFENTTKTLEFFNAVQNCVKKAEMSLLVIRVAIEQFETESMATDLGGSKKDKYAKTLKQLKKFQDKGDPFDDEFETQYKSICLEQAMLLEEFRKLQLEDGKKLRSIKKWNKWVQIGFATAIVSLIALSLLSFAPCSPMVMASLPSLIPPIVAAGEWVIRMLNNYENDLKEKIELSSLMEQGTKVNIEVLKTIKSLVEKLLIRLSSILEISEHGEEAMTLVMQEIIKKVQDLAEKIKEVGENAAECSKVIASARIRVLAHIADPVPYRKR